LRKYAGYFETRPPDAIFFPPPAPGAVPGNVPTGPTVPPKLLTFVLDGKGTLPK
jgi:hypothetical protein